MRILIKNLTKIYKTKNNNQIYALENINFSTDNEILGILGPNGAGKSTLLKCIASLLKPTYGEIFIGNLSVLKQQKMIRKSISMSFQDPPFDPRLSLEKNLFFHALACNISRSTKRKIIKDLMNEFDLNSAKNRSPHQLSGGMRRKADLIRTFMRNTPVYIFDEPTAMLDPPSRKLIWSKILSLKSEGKTILLATNDMIEAETVSDKIFMINNGVQIAFNTVPELKKLFIGRDTLYLKTNASIALLKDILLDLSIRYQVKQTDNGQFTIIGENLKTIFPKLTYLLYFHQKEIANFTFQDLSLDEIFFSLIKSSQKDVESLKNIP